MDINQFATRKTIAQGMLDLALLTANAAQLKRIMTIGPTHKFYYFLMTLIIVSICLQVVCTFLQISPPHIRMQILGKFYWKTCVFQVVQAVIMCILAIVFDLSKVEEHRRTNIANNILLMVTIVSVAINILISTFDIADFKWDIKQRKSVISIVKQKKLLHFSLLYDTLRTFWCSNDCDILARRKFTRVFTSLKSEHTEKCILKVKMWKSMKIINIYN